MALANNWSQLYNINSIPTLQLRPANSSLCVKWLLRQHECVIANSSIDNVHCWCVPSPDHLRYLLNSPLSQCGPTFPFALSYCQSVTSTTHFHSLFTTHCTNCASLPLQQWHEIQTADRNHIILITLTTSRSLYTKCYCGIFTSEAIMLVKLTVAWDWRGKTQCAMWQIR